MIFLMENKHGDDGFAREVAMISGVSKVVVPVDDQERARDFWTTKLGFEVVRDESYGDERWVEVRPPDGSPVLVLSPAAPPNRATRSPTSCRIRRSSSIARTSRPPTSNSGSAA